MAIPKKCKIHSKLQQSNQHLLSRCILPRLLGWKSIRQVRLIPYPQRCGEESCWRHTANNMHQRSEKLWRLHVPIQSANHGNSMCRVAKPGMLLLFEKHCHHLPSLFRPFPGLRLSFESTKQSSKPYSSADFSPLVSESHADPQLPIPQEAASSSRWA